jgi:hypothetical protein
VDIRWIEGEGIRHDTIFREPHAQKLAAEIARAIEEAQAQFTPTPGSPAPPEAASPRISA